VYKVHLIYYKSATDHSEKTYRDVWLKVFDVYWQPLVC